ncbi:MAG: type II toxin-antitoxin system RelE/ParE family toxin [Planctomycetota bacterium]
MSYILFYHPDIHKEDLPNIPRNIQIRISNAVQERLLKEPLKYGEPLKRSLQGYRKLRVGDYRVIYRIDQENIIILKIGHRKEVYRRAHLRI